MFLIGCQEVTDSGTNKCSFVTLSDALPVQFWLSECDTFNEFEAQGVHHVCWCQPWNCDDEIITQFLHTTGQTFYLVGKNSDGYYLFSSPFSESATGVYYNSLIPSNEDICDEKVQLLIVGSASLEFLDEASTWTNTLSSWAEQTNNKFRFNVPGNDFASSYMTFSSGLEAGTVVSFYLTVNTAVTNGTVSVLVQITDNATSFFVTKSFFITSTGLQTVLVQLTVPLGSTATRMYFSVEHTGGSAVDASFYFGTQTATVITPPMPVVAVHATGSHAKSDCLDVQTAHDETIFIEYSNTRNFAGLVFENESPDVTFKIRVPCRFVHEREPEEDEAIELTSSIVVTSSQIKTQRLLEVKHSPYYFHKKLRRILKHQNVTIFDKLWKQEDAYEVIEGKKTWPLKSATCWLTQGNSVVRNVL